MLRLALTTLVVDDYDRAAAWFVDVLGFTILVDRPLGSGKRWLVVTPAPGASGFLLARAVGADQAAAIGRQAGGRVAFFLETDDFGRDHEAFRARGVRFVESPRNEDYGIVAVFEDPWGNRWDLIQPAS